MPIPPTPDAATVAADAIELRPLALKIPAVARALDCSERHVWSLVEHGDLPSIKIGGARRVRYTDLVAYLDRLAGGAA